MALISFTDKGLYCEAGDFFIDPWKPVQHAVITHAHSDHARWGSQQYLCHRLTAPILTLRLGNVQVQAIEWNEPVYRNGVRISLHPAGHIIGSSQIRIEYKGEVWVVSGDYKTEPDGISGSFEPVPCHCFITESTFGLPIYQWQPQETIFGQIGEWIAHNQAEQTSSILSAYSLGKAQRLLQAVTPVTDRIYLHPSTWHTHEAFRNQGIPLPEVKPLLGTTTAQELKGAVVIVPPGAMEGNWMKKIQPHATAVCSGWMQVRGNFRRNNVDAGFPLSDHADWPGLLDAIRATGAEKVFVTHGFQAALSRYLNEQGIPAAEVKTAYGEEQEEPITQQNPPAEA